MKRHTINMQEAGRAWIDGQLPAGQYFALARRGGRPTVRDRLRQWLRRRKG